MIQNLAFELRGAARLLAIWGAAQPSQKLDIPVLAVLVYIGCSISPWSEMISWYPWQRGVADFNPWNWNVHSIKQDQIVLERSVYWSCSMQCSVYCGRGCVSLESERKGKEKSLRATGINGRHFSNFQFIVTWQLKVTAFAVLAMGENRMMKCCQD